MLTQTFLVVLDTHVRIHCNKIYSSSM